MQNIYVVTHTQSLHHLEKKVGGWYDTGLTDLGERQANSAAIRLAALTSGRAVSIICSDLKRASQTAAIISAELKCQVSTDSRLRENSYGQADGKSQNWLDERIVTAPHNDRLDHIVILGAESKRSFIERIYDGVSALPKSNDIIIVTHGYALTFVISCWIGLRIEDAGYVNFAASPGGITHLKEDDFFQNRAVIFLNDISHLSGVS